MAIILADSLRAKAEHKGNGQCDLGSLFPPVIVRWKRKLNDAIKAAVSWQKDDVAAELKGLIETVEAAAQSAGAEQWAINPSIHYNAWANLQATEFQLVVKSFQKLLDTMSCDKCGAYVEMQPRKGKSETIRCDCNDISINLKKRGD